MNTTLRAHLEAAIQYGENRAKLYVQCPDGRIRHAEHFATIEEAREYAEWGHACHSEHLIHSGHLIIDGNRTPIATHHYG